MPRDKQHHVDEVFGIARDLPVNYVPRKQVDETFVNSLAKDRHIVVYGSSKQGKTCLRKYNLRPEDYIQIACSNRWDLGNLHSQILKESGYTIEQSTRKTVAGQNKISAKARAGFKVPWVGGADAELGGDDTQEHRLETEHLALELDAYDVNDLIRALQAIEHNRFIVLEDFHYLSDQTQRDFAVALKALHEDSPYSCIVVGVWLDANKLIQHNGDLAGRLIPIDVDRWEEQELEEVISGGEAALNIRLAPRLKTELVSGCFESVSILQEACRAICEHEDIYVTQSAGASIGSALEAEPFIKSVVDAQSARYSSFVSNFAEGFMSTGLEMYRWLLLPVLVAEADELEAGLSYKHIGDLLREHHPRGSELNPGNITQALQSTTSLQVGKLGIKPIILDYDQSRRRLGVVDKGFIIWLQYQEKEELLGMVGLPVEAAGDG